VSTNCVYAPEREKKVNQRVETEYPTEDLSNILHIQYSVASSSVGYLRLRDATRDWYPILERCKDGPLASG